MKLLQSHLCRDSDLETESQSHQAVLSQFTSSELWLYHNPLLTLTFLCISHNTATHRPQYTARVRSQMISSPLPSLPPQEIALCNPIPMLWERKEETSRQSVTSESRGNPLLLFVLGAGPAQVNQLGFQLSKHSSMQGDKEMVTTETCHCSYKHWVFP